MLAVTGVATLRFTTLGLALVLGAMAGCASMSSEPDPTQIRIDDMDRRLGGVERVVNNQSLVELAQRIDQLGTQLRALNGRVEELQNAQEQLRTQQRSLYADLDKRVAAVETRGGGVQPPGVPATGSAEVAPTSGSPEQRYGVAFDALKGGNYALAISGFSGFLREFPTHALADNAQYWLGEAYYVTRDYERALSAFTRVGQQWPDSRKAADAALKSGYTQFELKRYAAARATLAEVSTRWPGSEAARLAQERLKRLPAAP